MQNLPSLLKCVDSSTYKGFYVAVYKRQRMFILQSISCIEKAYRVYFTKKTVTACETSNSMFADIPEPILTNADKHQRDPSRFHIQPNRYGF